MGVATWSTCVSRWGCDDCDIFLPPLLGVVEEPAALLLLLPHLVLLLLLTPLWLLLPRERAPPLLADLREALSLRLLDYCLLLDIILIS